MEFNLMNEKRPVISILAIAVALIATGGGCVSLTPDNFLPKSIAPSGNDQRIDGSVNVQAVVPDTRRGKVALFDNGTLRVALEKAIAQKGLFQRIEQGDADYVLDVGVIETIRLFKPLREGMTIDMAAIWRLTRAKDGKVIVCDFANGHGASHGLGTNAYVVAIETATREMIQKGLSKLSDRSTALAAMNVAGDWPSMGSVIPEGYRKLKENWSKLRKGLTEKEVREMIPSMPHRSCSINREFSAQVSSSPRVLSEPVKVCPPIEQFPRPEKNFLVRMCGSLIPVAGSPAFNGWRGSLALHLIG
jgi:hypothetical protein